MSAVIKLSIPESDSRFRLRAGRPEDAEACGVIMHTAFTAIASRHGFPSDFPTREAGLRVARSLLAHPGQFKVIAERDGEILGSNFMDERGPIAGIGPITVAPSAQDGQIGRRLMEAALERGRELRLPGIRLVQAAYHARSLSLYAKLGFEVREPLANLQGQLEGVTIPNCAVRAAKEADLTACDALCVRVHGHDRSAELLDAIRAGTATVVERAGRITGYATIIGFFGHAVAETNDDLKALIAAAPSFAGPGILVPTRNTGLFGWCLVNGLRVAQTETLMTIGLYNEPRGAYLPSILY